MEAEFQPDSQAENFDQNHVNNQEWKDAEAVKENEIHLKNPTTQQLFKGYYFDKNHQSLSNSNYLCYINVKMTSLSYLKDK